MKKNPGAFAYISLGSNLGDSLANVQRAMEWLESLSARPMVCSTLWRTAPVDCPPGSPDFVNAVVGIFPRRGETPETLLAKLQAVEQEFGRQPKQVQNEPRPLDLDLIAWGDKRRRSKALTLPHPRAHERKFVLQPLAEIAPDLVLPGQTETVFQLLAGMASGAVLLAAR